MSNNSNNILDRQELLNNDFEITFSQYWQKVERFIQRAYIFLGIILTVTVLSMSSSNFSISHPNYFLLFIIFVILFSFVFAFFIYQLQKFRSRDFKEKINRGRLWRLLLVYSLLILLLGILCALSIFAFFYLIYLFIAGMRSQSALVLIFVYIPVSLLSGFQTFYLRHSILYLVEHHKLKTQYV